MALCSQHPPCLLCLSLNASALLIAASLRQMQAPAAAFNLLSSILPCSNLWSRLMCDRFNSSNRIASSAVCKGVVACEGSDRNKAKFRHWSTHTALHSDTDLLQRNRLPICTTLHVPCALLLGRLDTPLQDFKIAHNRTFCAVWNPGSALTFALPLGVSQFAFARWAILGLRMRGYQGCSWHESRSWSSNWLADRLSVWPTSMR